jgi:hypothetical protein
MTFRWPACNKDQSLVPRVTYLLSQELLRNLLMRTLSPARKRWYGSCGASRDGDLGAPDAAGEASLLALMLRVLLAPVLVDACSSVGEAEAEGGSSKRQITLRYSSPAGTALQVQKTHNLFLCLIL